MNSLYTIIFNDGTEFEGGNTLKTKWNDIPDKPIKSIVYNVPLGNRYIISDFKRIYHYIEALKDLNGDNAGIVNLETTNLIVERENKYVHYKINLKDSIKNVLEYNLDNNFIRTLNQNFWKKGVKH